MSIRERKEQARKTRKIIIDHVIQEIIHQGYTHVSMRKIASLGDISLPALYKMFGSREELLAGAVEHVGELFYTNLSLQTNKCKPEWGSWGKIIYYGYHYVRFSLENRELFDFFSAFAPQLDVEDMSPDGVPKAPQFAGMLIRTFQDLFALVQDCVSAGQLVGHPRVLSYMLWMFIHGMSSLFSSAHIEGKIDKSFIENSIEAFMNIGLLIMTDEFRGQKIHLEMAEWIDSQFNVLMEVNQLEAVE